MIMKANKQIGFIYKNNESIDKILKDGDVVFEKGFLREKTSTTFPITFDGVGKDLKDYRVYGNTVQNGEPTPDTPIEMVSCGDLVTDTNDVNYGKYKIPVIVKSKNLFDDTTLSNKWINISGSVVDLPKSNCKRFECVEGETYTLSASYETQHASNIIVMAFYDSNDTLISRNVVSNLQYEELIATAPQNSKYLYAGYYTIEPQTIQLEKSDIATEYEPYVEPVITNIYLDEPLRKVGDYSDYIDFKNSKVVRNIAKKVLNGTEDWTLPSSVIDDYSSYRIVNFIPNLPLRTPIEELLCTHFEAFPKSQYQQEPIQNKITSYGDTNQIIVLVSNNIADSNNQTTTANWINWLSNNNITLYYPKQPTEKTISLPNIPTIDGNNTLNIETEITPSQVYIKYKSNE